MEEVWSTMHNAICRPVAVLLSVPLVLSRQSACTLRHSLPNFVDKHYLIVLHPANVHTPTLNPNPNPRLTDPAENEI